MGQDDGQRGRRPTTASLHYTKEQAVKKRDAEVNQKPVKIYDIQNTRQAQ